MDKHATKKSFPAGTANLSEYVTQLRQTGLERLKKVGEVLNTCFVKKPGVGWDGVQAAGDAPRDLAEAATLELAFLGKGGLLQIMTRNTTYTFHMLNGREAMLSTNQKDRPVGLVELRGCTFGCSNSISPGQVFCGGNLEFFSRNSRTVHLTSEIKSLRWSPPLGVTAANNN